MLDLPHYGSFDILVCQIPTIAPYKPEGGGGAIATLIDGYNTCMCQTMWYLLSHATIETVLSGYACGG